LLAVTVAVAIAAVTVAVAIAAVTVGMAVTVGAMLRGCRPAYLDPWFGVHLCTAVKLLQELVIGRECLHEVVRRPA
jgi:hypothetical protein